MKHQQQQSQNDEMSDESTQTQSTSTRTQNQSNRATDSKPQQDTADDEEKSDNEDRSVNLNPDYNISDVRSAIQRLKQQIELKIRTQQQTSSASSVAVASESETEQQHRWQTNDALQATLALLLKITLNLLKTNEPTKFATYRSLNLRNATLVAKITCYPAALDYLAFIGFRPKDTVVAPAAAAAATATASTSIANATIPLDCPSVSLESAHESQQRISRASAVLQRLIKEETLSEEEMELRTLGPIDHAVTYYNYDTQFQNSRLPSADEAPVETASAAADQRLLLQSMIAQRQENAFASRTDIILTKDKLAELKSKQKRRYTKSVVRVVFTVDACALQACFRPTDKLQLLFDMVAKTLSHDETPYYLRAPPNTRISPRHHADQTLRQLGLVPAATLFFAYEDVLRPMAGIVAPGVLSQRQTLTEHAQTVPSADNAAEVEARRKQAIDELRKHNKASSSGEPKDENQRMEDEIERRLAGRAPKRPAAATPAPGQTNRKPPSWLNSK